MGRSFLVEPASPEERPAAFRLLFQQAPSPEREERVANALRLIRQGELDSAGVVIAHGPDGLLGAMLAMVVPGASGLVWPPQVQPDEGRRDVEDALVQFVSAWLRLCGAKLGQALLSPPDAPLAEPLERNGYQHISRLWYLRHNLDGPFPAFGSANQIHYRTYDAPAHWDLFHQTLLRTYQETLDCPEVNEVRSLDEIISGHQAQGVYNPRRWFLALEADQPVGVLLLTEMPEGRTWDVSYVGVVPEARGRGLGRALMHKAMEAARASAVWQLTLSVDSRNRPACQLYCTLGFEHYDQREVYLAVWKDFLESARPL